MERLTSAKGLIDDTKQSKDIATDLLGHYCISMERWTSAKGPTGKNKQMKT